MNNSLDPIYNLDLLNARVEKALKAFIAREPLLDFTPARLKLLARIVNDPGQPTLLYEIYSHENNSYNIQKLTKAGWVVQVKSDTDGRFKYVHPTKQATDLIATYYKFFPTIPGLDRLCPASSASNVAPEKMEKAISKTSESKSSPSSSPKSPTLVTPP